MDRRPIAVRDIGISKSIARWLAQRGVTPNSISVSSLVFAALASYILWNVQIWGRMGYLLAGLFIGCRLLANMFDGMVAVEHEKGSVLGDLFNEIPDRISDALIIIGFGMGSKLSLLTAIVAILTAYIRAMGAVAGTKMYFNGPMGKQQRMFVLIAYCIVSLVYPAFSQQRILELPMVEATLYVLLLGGIWTCMSRTICIAKELRESV